MSHLGVFTRHAAAVTASLALIGCGGGRSVADAARSSSNGSLTRAGSSRGASSDGRADHAARSARPGQEVEPRESEAAAEDGTSKADVEPMDDYGGSLEASGGTAGVLVGVGAGTAAVADSLQRPQASDLEYSVGLPEPPQQSVMPGRPAWTPPTSAQPDAQPVIDDVWPDKGPSSGGERVVIRGRNLRGSQVLFGFSPAQIISATDDELTVAAPGEDAGMIAIAVTDQVGNYAVAMDAYRYYQ